LKAILQSSSPTNRLRHLLQGEMGGGGKKEKGDPPASADADLYQRKRREGGGEGTVQRRRGSHTMTTRTSFDAVGERQGEKGGKERKRRRTNEDASHVLGAP